VVDQDLCLAIADPPLHQRLLGRGQVVHERLALRDQAFSRALGDAENAGEFGHQDAAAGHPG
jgi:hypothetical protein